MHPDLALIIGLWQVDHATDLAQARARSLKTAVDTTQVRIDEIAQAQVVLKTEQDQLVGEESVLQRELDRYVIRRDRSRELLKGGSALDYLTVQKQLEQCTEKVSDLESKVMDCMLGQEELAEREAALVSDADAAATGHQDARSQWMEEGRLLRSELEALSASRTSKWAEFPRDLQSHYKDLRRRGREVVVPIQDGNCSACQITVNSQVTVDLNGGRRVHTCRGCHRYLTLPVDADEDEA